ncbi:MAG: CPBP family intramembrane metalloprotease [Lachnospiraceae bacterium]|nr:CPBP family intramembrane metalloprotease [Lachnospiraceae bacterium]
MTSKKKDLLSIAVYIFICFTLMFVFGPLIYTAEEGADFGAYQILYLLAAFSPCIACLVTRLLFREGFKGQLYPKFSGNFKAYFLAVVIPLVFGILNCVLITISTGAGFSFKLEGGIFTALGNNMVMSVYAYYAMIIIIGEELGWRGFLYDKLEKSFGLNGAVVIGGIIWGLWHIPPIVHAGLNFGKDYPGFPYAGIVLMCVMCIGFGAFLQLIRKMSGSVIAPIIAHGLIDSVSNSLATMFLSEEMILDMAGGKKFIVGICITVTAVIVGIPCWVVLNKRPPHPSPAATASPQGVKATTAEPSP